MYKPLILALQATAVSLAITSTAMAAEHVVVQKSKAFSMKKLSVKLGDTVKFHNDDPFSHNVFSLSDAKSFDLGSYGQGMSKSITFDKAGSIEVECAVHPDMKLVIEVAK
jgi:plastocyanin